MDPLAATTKMIREIVGMGSFSVRKKEKGAIFAWRDPKKHSGRSPSSGIIIIDTLLPAGVRINKRSLHFLSFTKSGASCPARHPSYAGIILPVDLFTDQEILT